MLRFEGTAADDGKWAMVGVRFLGAVWALLAIKAVIHATGCWLGAFRCGLPPWVVNQLIWWTATVHVSWRAIVAAGIFYYLMYRGERLGRVLSRKTAGCAERRLYLAKLFVALLGVGLCLRGAAFAAGGGVQVGLLKLSPLWQTADSDVVQGINLNTLAEFWQAAVLLGVGGILYWKCDAAAGWLRRRLPEAEERDSLPCEGRMQTRAE